MATVPQRIEAQEFVLKDAAGRIQGSLMATADGPAFVLLDGKGERRIELRVNEGPSRLAFRGNGKAHIDRGEGAQIVMWDRNGQPRLAALDTDDGPQLMLSDERRVPRVMLNALSESIGVSLADTAGVPRLILTSTEDGVSLQLLDDQGKPRACLSAVSTWADLSFFDGQGTLLISLPAR